MATVIVKVSGGSPKEVSANTLGELKAQLNLAKHQATINGEPESDDSYQLENDSLVIFTEQIKGA